MYEGTLSDWRIAPRTSPIQAIPYELLAEIMFFALAPRTDGQYMSVSVCVNNVLALCQVCAYWRAVAQNTPRLWTLDSFPILITNGGVGRMATKATEMFLQRSAPLPISIEIVPGLRMCRSYDLPAILDTLIRVAHRWKSFTLASDIPESELAALKRIPAGRLDGLDKLELLFRTREMWGGPELDVFSSAPRLRDVTITVWNTSSINLPMPWGQLTQLTLAYDSPQLCLDILGRCPNLVSVRLRTKQWQEEDVILGAETVSLPHLKTLDITIAIWTMGQHLTPFLHRLKLSALTYLCLSIQLASPESADWYISWFAPALIYFLTRAPNLEFLYSNRLDAEDMPDILQHTPCMTRLSFAESPVYDEFFAALRYSATDPAPLVPGLETLELADVGEDWNESSLLEMIRSRWWSDDELLAMPTPPAVARLKHVLWYSGDFPSWTPEFTKTLAAYEVQGLKLTGF
ncbi:hypothetical protein B0H17DRAFT_1175257 [Mycena rosella]|uniref:F-box domain-containing protein n=1 Tax=Mycena rosella TaxID=1033263 RepID=A0AAD7GUG6_MYCRO|nr:hypothetical protein B0H17DRAFT_1175257 [Mycena rosella]